MKHIYLVFFFIFILQNIQAQIKRYKIIGVDNVEFVNKKMVPKGMNDKLTKLGGFIIDDLTGAKTLILITGKDSIKYKSVIIPKLIQEDDEVIIMDYYLVDKKLAECILRVTDLKQTNTTMFSFIRGTKSINYMTVLKR